MNSLVVLEPLSPYDIISCHTISYVIIPDPPSPGNNIFMNIQRDFNKKGLQNGMTNLAYNKE